MIHFFARSIESTKNSCSLPVSPGAGTRPEVSGVLGHENLNEKTPSLLLATASTKCNFLPSGSMDVMDLLDFFSSH